MVFLTNGKTQIPSKIVRYLPDQKRLVSHCTQFGEVLASVPITVITVMLFGPSDANGAPYSRYTCEPKNEAVVLLHGEGFPKTIPFDSKKITDTRVAIQSDWVQFQTSIGKANLYFGPEKSGDVSNDLGGVVSYVVQGWNDTEALIKIYRKTNSPFDVEIKTEFRFPLQVSTAPLNLYTIHVDFGCIEDK